jgi:hypothetical protein
MKRRLRQLSGKRLADPELEQSRRETHEAIIELQGVAAHVGVVLPNVLLEDGVSTPVAHGLARVPVIIKQGIVRGAATAGVITELARDARTVTLQADGFGADIRVELEVA